jgi:epoxyqueuosine reductase QueG
MADPFTIVGGVLAIGSAIFGTKAKKKARRASKEETKAVLLQNFIQRRQALRKFRQDQALAEAAARAAGAGPGSSAIQGAKASGRTQFEEALANSMSVEKFSVEAARLRRSAAKNAGIAGIFGTASSLAFTAGNLFGGKDPDTGNINPGAFVGPPEKD